MLKANINNIIFISVFLQKKMGATSQAAEF